MNTTQTQSGALSRKEAAQYLGVCLTTLNRLGIPRAQVRRRALYRRETLDAWLTEHETPGAQSAHG